MASKRLEKDAMGQIEVESSCYWGASTERSRHNFPIVELQMPKELIRALIIVKKAACQTNYELQLLSHEKYVAITQAADELLSGKLSDQFPLSVFQTGSGTQTNMNVNEVIANRAIEIMGGAKGSKEIIHPNDDVNMSQSSNDTFPTAMHIAACQEITEKLLPSLQAVAKALKSKEEAFSSILKIGRTHLMDAVPMTLGQEFSGYHRQIELSIDAVKKTLPLLYELALGGTAIGTGINCPEGFSQRCVQHIAEMTKLPFKEAPNFFQALASHEAILFCSGALKTAAAALYKIASDIRLLGSGPRAGFAELFLPENEPGSSIMPGKVNPTQSEAVTMIAAQVIGCDATISFAASQGHFELNVFKPVIIYNLLLAVHLLSEGCKSFASRCIEGISPNHTKLKEFVDGNLMLATALNPIIGYDKAAGIVKKAHAEGKSLKQAAIELGFFSEAEFDKVIDSLLKQCTETKPRSKI